MKKGTHYKFFVVAFDAAGHKLASSKTVHVATSGGKAGNYKSVKLTNMKKNKLTLKKGEEFSDSGKADRSVEEAEGVEPPEARL